MRRRKLKQVARPMTPAQRQVIRFWNNLWKTCPSALLREGIGQFQRHTVAWILDLEGTPKRWATSRVVEDGYCRSAQSLDDLVHYYLRDGSIFFEARGAGNVAIMCRYYFYCAKLFQPKYDGMSVDQEREYFRECRVRANWEFLESIEALAKRRGMENFSLGRP